MQDFLQKLHEQIQARYPLFYFVSHEEERVWRAMSFFAQSNQYRLFRWRRTIGLESDQGVIPNTKEPQEEPLDHIMQADSVGGTQPPARHIVAHVPRAIASIQLSSVWRP